MRILLVIILVVSLGLLGYWVLNSPPQLHVATEPKAIGRATTVKLSVEDRSGVRRLTTWWEQEGRRIPIEERELAGARRSEVELAVGPLKQQGLKDGRARLVAEATDAAWLLPKFRAVGWDVTVRSQPPRLAVLSGQHYINQGGGDMVVYQVSEAAIWSGVRVGQRMFPGYAMPGGAPGTHFAIFAFPYDEPAATAPQVVARDEAGNEAVAAFWYKLFPKSFRRREIVLSDSFLQQVVPAILSQSNEIQDRGDLLQNFLEINRTLRRINNERITQMARESEPRFLWSEPFAQLPGSQVEAQFADRRTYVYQGKQVDQQDHLGFDLATVQRAPVEAANRGKVVFAGWLGIYGNTIVLDHGYGLQSLYGHLATFEVKAGDLVEKRQVIARSDSTGLAAGDHLHFSMLLAGQQVNPTEWWDPHWIHDRLLMKFPGGKLP